MERRNLLKKGIIGTVALSTLLCLANPNTVNAATWKKNQVGWWYQEDNGSWAANTWRKVNGSWYWFDQNGYMATGWRLIGGKWYYLQSSGAMLEQGWHWIGDKCYYMYDSGAMAANTWIGNYYVDGSGKWVPGKTKAQTKWVQSGNRWWYRHSDGSYTKNGWEKINGQWYYFDNAGWMVANQWVGDYYVTASGAMATNTWIGNYYVDGSGKWVPDAQKNQHEHSWVEKKHEEVGHWENKLIKNPWDETVHHEAEGHYENGDLISPEEGHYETIHHEAEYKTVHHEAEYKTVHHEAEYKTVHHEAEYKHHEAIYDTIHHEEEGHWEIVTRCHNCGFIITSQEEAVKHINENIQNGCSSYGDFEEWVVDKEAWDEDYWVVDKPAVYEQVWVVDKEAWDEIIHHEAIVEKQWKVDKAAYTEIICSGCGEKKR